MSQKPLSDRWLTSAMMCRRSISARNSKPFSFKPVSVLGAQGQMLWPPPGTTLGLASSFSWFQVRVIMRTPKGPTSEELLTEIRDLLKEKNQ